ncbi:MAG: SEL1-like repeat protein [Ruminococcus bicirculans]|nr:SEL1-like repeat protein [Ruminococcus bicirculans (ex Wegman et al. 2014)]
MPKLIVTSRYLKSGSGKKKQLYHYVKYIATREGSVPIPNANETAPATKSQQELISSLLHDFPDSKELFEYEDYQKNPTIKNGSALISVILDRNMDRLTSRENYVGYLANRPGTVKFGSHGLFSQSDEPINLEKVAKDIANHGGNVWTHVVSLRRDNAQAMGYDNLKAWRELVKRQISNIAKNQKIDMANLKWYAAFHDKKTNPHVHIIVYSTNEREGFLTNHGIEKIRSGFANDIYADELHHLYAQQTDLRNQMKKESEQLMKQLADNISQNDVDNAELIDLVAKLHEQLNSSKGKKVYGYLKADVKKTVDEIFIRLAENESIQKMYSLWCEMEQQKHDVYSSARVQFPKLADNKEFKSVKNMIIQTVLDMNSPVVDIEIEEPELTEKTDDDITDIPPQIDEFDNAIYFDNDDMAANGFSCSSKISPKEPDDSPKSKYYLKWSNAYKEACKLIYNKQSKLEDFQKAEQLLLNESGAGNVLAIHDLGKLYSTEKIGAKDEEKSFAYYNEALQGFMEIELDSDFMFPYEPKFDGQIIKPVNMRSYVWYRIGKMHCYGLGTEQDHAQSFEWFLKSDQEGNKFAQYSLANLYYYGNGVEKDLSQAFLWYQKSASQGQPYASYAAAQMYSKGEYVAENKETAQRYYKAALSGFLELESKDQADDNLYYKLGAMYKNGLGTEIDIPKAIEYFEKSTENMWSTYQLGRLYLFGAEELEKDKEKAVEWLTKSANDGNEYAQNMLDNMAQFENTILANTIFALFANLCKCIEDDYTQKYKSVRHTVDSRLRRMIRQKKQSFGIKDEQSQSYEQS